MKLDTEGVTNPFSYFAVSFVLINFKVVFILLMLLLFYFYIIFLEDFILLAPLVQLVPTVYYSFAFVVFLFAFKFRVLLSTDKSHSLYLILSLHISLILVMSSFWLLIYYFYFFRDRDSSNYEYFLVIYRPSSAFLVRARSFISCFLPSASTLVNLLFMSFSVFSIECMFSAV